jgi:hypothetical protein
VIRPLLLCAVLTAFPLPARAEQTMTDTETVIRLNVQAMPAPKPALRYLLLPELKEMQPGNPIENYLKCILDQDFSSQVETLRPSALRQADRAARMDKPDWQIQLKLKTDGVSLLLPDLQKMRMLASALQQRFHAEVVQRRFDDAVRSAKTMFALSRHMGEHPTLIGDLVGIAIAFVAIGPLEEMLEQPGCPNLYWALTNLPSPLVSMDKGMEGERIMIQAELRDLDEKTPMNEEQLRKLLARIDELRALDGKPNPRTRAWLNHRNKDAKLVQAARHRLVEVGFSEKRLAQFPADQVLLLDAKREFEVSRDEMMKLMNLPTWQAQELGRQIKPPKKDEGLFEFLVPTLLNVHQAKGRLEQRIALLRHVEALRLYAADHDAKLPEKLRDCPVPLPVDPFAGKPFRYRRDGDTAHLLGTPPKGMEKAAPYNLHYEITIQKTAKSH